jgi:hypothetical protein
LGEHRFHPLVVAQFHRVLLSFDDDDDDLI